MKKQKYVLVKGDICWADEFDCEVMAVFTKEEWDKLCKRVQKGFKKMGSVSVGFGTNEELEFSSYEDWFNEFEVIEIEENYYDFLKKHFGDVWGTGSSATFEYIVERLESEE